MAAPRIIPATALGRDGRPPASQRVVLGYIGTGVRGRQNLQEQLNCPQAQLVAVCDVWGRNREAARKLVDDHYHNTSCQTYNDFRELLARDDIDAVGIATPDHWHVPMTVAAARAGKDVHCEKPLGICAQEDLVCREVIKRYGRVFQYGAESRSAAICRQGAELVRSGRIGEIREIRVKSPNSSRGGSTQPQPVPEGLDYDLWLGPAPWRPYSGCPDGESSWYHVRDYGLGFIAGWAAHPLDLLVWAYDIHQAGDWEIEGTGIIPTEGCNDAVIDWDVAVRFGNGVKMKFFAAGVPQEEDPRLKPLYNYAQLIGTEGWVAIHYMGLETEPASLRSSAVGPEEVHLPISEGQEQNFIECVQTRQMPVDPIEDAVQSDLVSQLSDIAIRAGRRIKWDPVAEQIVGDEEASRFLTRALRQPWRI
jgi:predicted dehydrogenase